MPKEDWSMTPFSTSDPQGQTRRLRQRTEFRAWTRRREQDRVRAGSMLAKIGFCVGLLAVVVLAQAFLLKYDADLSGRASVVSAEGDSQETGDEDVLGRLRYVESGAVKSVFAASQRWRLPVAAGRMALVEDETLLRITASAGKTVSVSAAGEVRALGADAALGDYVRVYHGSDLESVYYGLADIRVEEGQPLMPQDTLGKLGSNGTMHVAVLLNGAPQDPSKYLDTEE